jgi:hypothetical protein
MRPQRLCTAVEADVTTAFIACVDVRFASQGENPDWHLCLMFLHQLARDQESLGFR